MKMSLPDVVAIGVILFVLVVVAVNVIGNIA